MCESGSAVALDMQRIPWGGQEHVVKTTSGPISVFLCGDQGKPPLITYPDVALNYMSCFQGFFFCPEASSLIFRNFCIYHIDAPGHELGAAAISSEQPKLTVDGLADQVAQVLDYFGLQEVTCMGVTAGAYILTLFAMKYPKRVQGLILVSPLCQAPSWTEWFYNKLIINLLHYHGMCGMVKETLLQRYFSKDLRALSGAESDIVEACRRLQNVLGAISELFRYEETLLDERQSRNVGRFLDAMNRRKDLSDSLKELKCRTLIFVGEKSPFHNDALHFSHAMDTQYNALVEVQACGSLVTEEQPLSMLVPLDYFLMQYAFYKPLPPSGRHGSPVSPLSPLCISPELLSPESLGLKLKPIKTRVAVEDRHLHASILPIFGKRQP